MKSNNSLARFNGVITGLAVLGAVLSLIGILLIAMNSGYDLNMTAILNGIVFLYSGGGLIGLAIFGAFLRITATSIIEGVAISLADKFGKDRPAEGTIAAVLEHRAAKKQAQSKISDSERDALLEGLYNYQRKDWVEAGSPDLEDWVEAGKPDFDTWLESLGKN